MVTHMHDFPLNHIELNSFKRNDYPPYSLQNLLDYISAKMSHAWLCAFEGIETWELVGRAGGRARSLALSRRCCANLFASSPIDENAIKCYFFSLRPRPFARSLLALLCRDCSRGLMGVLDPNRMGGIKEGGTTRGGRGGLWYSGHSSTCFPHTLRDNPYRKILLPSNFLPDFKVHCLDTSARGRATPWKPPYFASSCGHQNEKGVKVDLLKEWSVLWPLKKYIPRPFL